MPSVHSSVRIEATAFWLGKSVSRRHSFNTIDRAMNLLVIWSMRTTSTTHEAMSARLFFHLRRGCQMAIIASMPLSTMTVCMFVMNGPRNAINCGKMSAADNRLPITADSRSAVYTTILWTIRPRLNSVSAGSNSIYLSRVNITA